MHKHEVTFNTLKRVIRWCFHTDDVLRSLLPVICYCFTQSLIIRISSKECAGPGLNVRGPKRAGPNKFWRQAGPKNQRAGPDLEYWPCAVV